MPEDGMRIDLPAALVKRLKAQADASGESVEALISRALASWLGDDDADARTLAELERRWADVEAGAPTHANENVVRWLRSWGASEFRPARRARTGGVVTR